jgi:hypothetical protein
MKQENEAYGCSVVTKRNKDKLLSGFKKEENKLVQLKMFIVPLDDESSMDIVNKFLRGHKTLEIKYELVKNQGAYWCICIKYLDSIGISFLFYIYVK